MKHGGKPSRVCQSLRCIRQSIFFFLNTKSRYYRSKWRTRRTLKDLRASPRLSLSLDREVSALCFTGLSATAASSSSVRGNLIKSTDFSKGQPREPTQLIKWVTPLLFVALCSPFLIWLARRNPLAAPTKPPPTPPSRFAFGKVKSGAIIPKL